MADSPDPDDTGGNYLNLQPWERRHRPDSFNTVVGNPSHCGPDESVFTGP